MKHVVLVLMTVLGMLVAGVTNAQASTVCFATKQELKKVVPPGQKIFYTTMKQTNNDHVDFINPFSSGAKCWHIHYKLPEATHMPKKDNYAAVEYMLRFWPLPDYKPI
jgi:hypothetical protein